MSILEPEIVHDAFGMSTKVVFSPLPFSKTVSIGILVGAGSITEDNSHIGYSHFLEHMLFKGTKTLDFEALNREFEKLGAYVNAFTGKYYTLFYVHTLQEFTARCLSILLEMIFESILPPEEIEKEKNVVLEEIASYKDSPEDCLIEEFYSNTFYDSFFGYPILGEAANIEKITREELLSYYQKYYSPSNTVISFAGNFDKVSLLTQLEGFFDRLPVSAYSTKILSKTPIPFHVQNKSHHKADLEQSYVCLGFHAPLDGVSRQVFKIFNAILGGMASSRLNMGVREKRALCYSIDSSLYMDPNIGFFNVFAATKAKQLPKLLDAIWEEIRSLRQKPISEEEIMIAKNQFKSRIIFRQENIPQTMLRLAMQTFFLGKILSEKKILEKTNQIEVKDFEPLYDYLSEDNMSAHILLTKKHLS